MPNRGNREQDVEIKRLYDHPSKTKVGQARGKAPAPMTSVSRFSRPLNRSCIGDLVRLGRFPQCGNGDRGRGGIPGALEDFGQHRQEAEKVNEAKDLRGAEGTTTAAMHGMLSEDPKANHGRRRRRQVLSPLRAAAPWE